MPTDSNGEVIMRRETITTPVQSVAPGDLLFGMPIRYSEPSSDFIWRLQAWTDDEQAGIELLITNDRPVTVDRMVPLRENQCIDCGRDGVKYAAKRQCSRCYQRQHRATARSQSGSRTRGEVELPYPA